MFDEAMKVMNKKLTKSNYSVNIFLRLKHIILQLFLPSSSLLFLSVERGWFSVYLQWMIIMYYNVYIHTYIYHVLVDGVVWCNPLTFLNPLIV